MRKYMPFEPLYLSFFSSAFYKDVARSWGGIGFLYTLLLQLFAWVILSGLCYVQLGNLISNEGARFAAQVPSISIIDGTVTMDRPSPYIIKDGDGNPFLIIDTEGSLTKYEENPAAIVLTKHQLIIHKERGGSRLDETRVFDLKQANGDILIDKASVEGLMQLLRLWLPILMIIVCWPFMIALYLIGAVLNAALGLIAKAATNSDLDFGAILRISNVAMTPGVVLGLIDMAAGLRLPIMLPLCILVTLGYLVFGIVASKEPVVAVVPAGAAPMNPLPPVNPGVSSVNPNMPPVNLDVPPVNPRVPPVDPGSPSVDPGNPPPPTV